MIERGQVIELLPDNYVKVCFQRTEACAKCGACNASGEDMTVIAYNPDGAQISEWVNLSLENKYFISAALILYGLPLLALLIGITVGYYGTAVIHLEQFSSIAGLSVGVLFTIAAFYIIRVLDKKIKKSLYIPIAHLDTNISTHAGADTEAGGRGFAK